MEHCGYLKVAELQEAEREILKRVQQVSFPNVMEILSSTENHKGGNCVMRVLQRAGAPLLSVKPTTDGRLTEGWKSTGKCSTHL